MNIHAVVVNWNNAEETLRCLESLWASHHPMAVHIVDNGSRDGSRNRIAAALQKRGHWFIHPLKSNRGFAGGANVGIRSALEQGADGIWLINNDSVCDSRALSSLVLAAEQQPDAGLYGGRVYSDRANDILWACGVKMGWTPNLGRLRGHHKRGRDRYLKREEVDSLTGCGLLILKSVFDEIGLLDEAYFVYVEDADFCDRAKEKGFRCLYVPDAVIEHAGGGSTGGGYGAARKYLTAYHSVMFLKRRPSWSRTVSFGLFDLLPWPLVLLKGVLMGKAAGALGKGRGMLHGLLGRSWDRSVLSPAESQVGEPRSTTANSGSSR